jgi:hypothetical protein
MTFDDNPFELIQSGFLLAEDTRDPDVCAMRLIPLRVAPWPGGSVAGSPWGRPLLMSNENYQWGVSVAARANLNGQ